MSKRGKFIVVEGEREAPCEEIASHLAKKFSADLLYEPGNDRFSASLQYLALEGTLAGELSVAEQFLCIQLARSRFLQVVVPKLECGQHVVCPHFDMSTFAAFLVASDEVRLLPVFLSMRDKLFCEALPDLYLWLDLSPDEVLERQNASEETEHESLLHSYAEKRRGFREFSRRFYSSVVEIDAMQPLQSLKGVTEYEVQKILS